MNDLMQNVKTLHYDGNELAVEVGVCPGCSGLLGIDWTYLDAVNTCVICPMCGSEVDFGE